MEIRRGQDRKPRAGLRASAQAASRISGSAAKAAWRNRESAIVAKEIAPASTPSIARRARAGGRTTGTWPTAAYHANYRPLCADPDRQQQRDRLQRAGLAAPARGRSVLANAPRRLTMLAMFERLVDRDDACADRAPGVTAVEVSPKERHGTTDMRLYNIAAKSSAVGTAPAAERRRRGCGSSKPTQGPRRSAQVR